MNKPTKKANLSKQAKWTLAAVKKLLAHYRGGYKKERLWDCPLCEEGCESCPWEVLEGDWCMACVKKIGGKRMYPTPAWRAASIKRLSRWARLIKNGTYDKALKEAKP